MKCSLCKKGGHNKRTCKNIIETDKENRIRRLKDYLIHSNENHELQLMKLNTLKEAHIYCVINNISAQHYGILLEKYIRLKYNYKKNKAADCIGDCSKDDKNMEIKVSLGGKTHNKFNFVQIRPSHDCDTYLLTAYYISIENVETEGELYIFHIPKADLKHMIVSFGGYAHGTKKEYGDITMDSFNDIKNIKEYAIRPKLNDKCWKALMSFRVLEDAF